MRLEIFSIIVAGLVMLVVLEMLRRRRLREKYAVLWLAIAVATVVAAAWPEVVYAVSGVVGVDTPSNLLFLVAIAVSFLVALQLSSEVGRLEEESRTLAEEVGMLRLQVEELSLRVTAIEERTAARLDPRPHPDFDPGIGIGPMIDPGIDPDLERDIAARFHFPTG